MALAVVTINVAFANPRPLQAQEVAEQLLAAAFPPAFPDSQIALEPAASAAAAEAHAPWGSWSTATGDWGGTRTTLENTGIAVTGSYVYDASSVVRGGLRRGTVGRGLLDLGIAADLEELAGLRGASLFFGFHSHGGPNGSDYTGDMQAYSNVDAEKFAQIAEVYYEQRLFGERLRLKLGQVDANSEFAAVGTAGEFINASAGFSPTMYGLPTYPNPVPSVNAFVRPLSWLAVGGGVYHGPLATSAAPTAETGALFGIGEIAGNWSSIGRLGAGRLEIGYWGHNGYAPQFTGGMQRSPTGWYATLEQRVSGHGATDSARASGVTIFAKYGHADERISDFAQHFMFGLVQEQPFGLDGHAAGLMLSAVDLSDQAAAGYARNEASVEAFYRWPALGFLTLRPDLQYIASPSGAIGVADAVVGTLRMEVAF